MVFLILNFILLCCFIFITYIVDKKNTIINNTGNTILLSLLLICAEIALYILVLIFENTWLESFTVQIIKVIFCLEGMCFVSFSYGLVSMTTKIKSAFAKLLKWILYGFCIYLAFWRFVDISIDVEKGWIISSEPLFSGTVQQFFPWDWYFIYSAIYRYIIPGTAFLFMMVFLEKKGSQLQKYQSLVIAEGIVLMWILRVFFNYVGSVKPEFLTLYMYSYLAMYIMVILALKKTSIPSGKAYIATLIKNLISYVIPSCALGFFIIHLQPVGNLYQPNFVALFAFVSIVAILFSMIISDILTNNSRLYTADYGPALEKQLASINYSGEMDEITGRMYEIFRKNVEASSVNVYILNNKNMLETAYTSNGFSTVIPLNNAIFETLLNINKSVVCYSEIGNVHAISTIEEQLTKFFEDTKSDALFILNEGHNILGLITLGKKISGDHYKEYDYNVFVKLYSYFFVFGYYMRNISNKEIISVVNREIKMSSQIITSIQENIDHVKNPKVDTGYLMVPARNIGGEFIDMIRLTDTRHLFVVGDMSGKGIAASMNMVILKSIIRTYLAETHDFKNLVVKVNSFIRDSLNKGTIFAGLFALIDFETDTMYYINCGIPALMLYTQVYNNVIEIQGSGHILGFVKDISPYISVKTTKLNPGDIILASTDGLVKSHSLRGEQFGKERIQQCILDNSTYPAQRMTQFTFDNLIKFMSKEMEDDVSILVLKYGAVRDASKEDENYEQSEETVEQVEASEVPEDDVETEVTEVNAKFTPVEAVAEDVEDDVEVPAESVEQVVEEPAQEEQVAEQQVVETAAEETKNEDASAPVSAPDGLDLPDDPDIPDLSDLDAMLKMAGL